MSAVIRLARADEVALLQQIEVEAGRLYGQVGMPEDFEGLPTDLVAAAIAEALVWVVEEEARAVGFALCWDRGEALHLRELDVLPSHMRRGLGRMLVEHVGAQARVRGHDYVSLTTFRDVPWNAPLYRRWG
ncbi:MAG: GNAT family N-acetyltransferase, partial [Myxococcales bacterium]|nr:GNAT family N-acetyltransferase [Myxococcales bacterium]